MVLALLIVLQAAASPARAAEGDAGPCTGERGSPSCQFAYGDVAFVADGDTIDVSIRGVGMRRIRVTGINAMEHTRYSKHASRRRGACHALAATARVEGLLKAGGGTVRLAAQDPQSMAGRRLRRQVSTWIDEAWVDIGRVLVAEGRALWLPNGVEYAWNRSYKQLSEQAAARRQGLFDSDACGPGPAADIQPELELRWDARGNDGINVNGEWVKIRNPSPRALDLAGWRLGDSSARRFTFPSAAVLPPDGDVTLHVGRGVHEGNAFYWGLPGPAFENASGGRRAMGDGAYLFDPRGNLRAWVIYSGRGDAPVRWPRRTVIAGMVAIALLLAALVGLLHKRT